MLLGDLGADVIRVDPVAGVGRPPPIDYTVRRGQRSLAADVKDPRGRDLVHRLAGDADAFVDVYRPGVAERLGIGPDALRERNPRLVYARMTGFGQDGPPGMPATTSTTSRWPTPCTASARPKHRCRL
jgi:alpha-methylacyl-CoA racemase